jgi:hypothetical protein
LTKNLSSRRGGPVPDTGILKKKNGFGKTRPPSNKVHMQKRVNFLGQKSQKLTVDISLSKKKIPDPKNSFLGDKRKKFSCSGIRVFYQKSKFSPQKLNFFDFFPTSFPDFTVIAPTIEIVL